MSQKFDIYKKDSGNFLGSVEASNPRDAARQILGFSLSTHRFNDEDQNEGIVRVDENTFEISLEGEDYTIKKSASV